MEYVIEVLSNFGYPVAMSLILFYYVKYTNDKHSLQIDNMTKQHKEEMDNVTTALNNNTLVMQKLIDKLESEE